MNNNNDVIPLQPCSCEEIKKLKENPYLKEPEPEKKKDNPITEIYYIIRYFFKELF